MTRSPERRAALAAVMMLLGAVGALGAPDLTADPRSGHDDAVDRWVVQWMEDHGVPGLSLAVVDRGRVVKMRGYGLASVELEVPASTATVYRLASVTKAFTGAAVMVLVESGRMSLDDPVEKHLDGLPEHWHGISIRRLLTHTSGLPDLIEESPFELRPIAPSLLACVELLADEELAFATGTAWRYNQTNYALVQAVVEAVSGQSFVEFVQEALLAPAGMDDTIFGGPGAVVKGRGPWYSTLERTDGGLRTGGRLRRIHVDYPDFMLSAGGLNATVADMARWDRALREHVVLSARGLTELWKPVTVADGSVFRLDGELLGYALGWSTADRPGHRAVWASGGNTVAHHRYLDDDLAVIVLTNCQGASPNALAEGIAGFYVPELREPPVFLAEPPDGPTVPRAGE